VTGSRRAASIRSGWRQAVTGGPLPGGPDRPYRAAESMQRGEPYGREASIAELHSSEAAMDDASQLGVG
jgi:hypothetical protein